LIRPQPHFDFSRRCEVLGPMHIGLRNRVGSNLGFPFVAIAGISLRPAVHYYPFDHSMFSRRPGRKAKNSQLTLDGNEQLAKPAFQMEELLLFYSSS
jgi:hypothetical protein